MPSIVTDWFAMEQRIVDRLRKVRMKQDSLRAEHDRLTGELQQVRATRQAVDNANAEAVRR